MSLKVNKVSCFLEGVQTAGHLQVLIAGLENVTELTLYVCRGRVRLEAFSDNSGKLQLSLQEIIEWLTAKDEELSEQLPIGGDVGAVQHQREFHQVRQGLFQFVCPIYY